MKRKKTNKTTLAIIVVALVAIGAIVGNVSKWLPSASDRESEKILVAFDQYMAENTPVKLENRRLVVKQRIYDFQCYERGQYDSVLKEQAEYISFLRYAELNQDERKKLLSEQKKKVSAIQKQNDTLTLFEEMATLEMMEGLQNGRNSALYEKIQGRLDKINEVILKMTKYSPGWRYIIESQLTDSLSARFIMVAPDKEPYKLIMGGGSLRDQDGNIVDL